ncbi:MAG: STAS domain-containing protein, partial [Chloroflexi bacterium]
MTSIFTDLQDFILNRRTEILTELARRVQEQS